MPAAPLGGGLSRPASASMTPRNPKPNSTYFHESALPKLPIPSVSDTLQRYLALVQPIQTPAAHLKTVECVTRYIESGKHIDLRNRPS